MMRRQAGRFLTSPDCDTLYIVQQTMDLHNLYKLVAKQLLQQEFHQA